ncbi:MAG: prefoldin subunit [Candidatus Heimdallarchaeaceae archaeon]
MAAPQPQLTPEQQKEIQRYYELLQGLEAIRYQIHQLELENHDVENAQRETKDLPPDTTIYRYVGRLLYQTTVEEVHKYLKEQKEKLEVSLSSLKIREQKILASLKEIESKLPRQQ